MSGGDDNAWVNIVSDKESNKTMKKSIGRNL